MNPRYGFTLLELSIVLVIIGLVVGGLVGGTALIRQSALNRVATEHDEIISAVQAYKLKYNALPGDHANAVQYWARADGGADLTQNCASPNSTPGVSTSKATCNGDGDGKIDDSTHEAFRFWQHLSNAGLIPGTFTGIKFSASDDSSKAGVNVPASRLEGGAWFTDWQASSNGTVSMFRGWYGHQLILGNGTVDTNDDPDDPIATAPEVAAIDTKIDDGRPAVGKLRVRWFVACTDAASNADLTANYRLDNNAIACSFIFADQY
jgi:prepilin-type N-terminal cleavage/methylation domain-containing protein